MVAPESAPSEDPALEDPPQAESGLRVVTDAAHPFARTFIATIAVIVALALAAATITLSTIVITVGVALFLSLALDPVVRRLERRGLGRGRAIGVVFSVFLALLAVLVFFVIPSAVNQVISFAHAVPGYIANIRAAGWFQGLVSATGGPQAWNAALDSAQAWLSDPSRLLALGSGVLNVASGVVKSPVSWRTAVDARYLKAAVPGAVTLGE